eukprot:5007432-Prorocentrum_lima.AAC.1
MIDEANSLTHLLTHFPKNPMWEIYQKAKMQHRQHRRVKPGPWHGPSAEQFGDSCTIDHWVALEDLSRGLG